MKHFADAFFKAIPDLEHDVEDAIASGDRVAIRLRLHGKHTKPLVGPAGSIPAQGKDIDFEAMNIWRFEAGKLAEQWIVFDMLTVLQQVGAMPSHPE